MKNKIDWKFFIKEHTVNKKSVKALALEYNMPYSTLYYGLKREMGKIPNKALTDLRKSVIKDDYFSNINSEEKAYWLGWMITDGYVDNKRNRIALKLAEVDKYIVELFKTTLSSNPNISQDKSTLRGKPFYSYRAEIKSEQLVKDLTSHGCCPNKTGKEVLPNIGSEYTAALIRGIFDGDGSISINSKASLKKSANVYVCCTNKRFLVDIQMLLGFGNIYTERRGNNKDMHKLMFTSWDTKKRFFDFIYSDSTIYLKRKYTKYSNYVNTVVKQETKKSCSP